MKKRLYFLLLLFVLTGCSTNPQVTVSQATPIPTPKPGTGSLYGSLIDTRTSKPFEASLYLSKNLTLDHPGYPPLVAFSYKTDPAAQQDDKGNFVFKDVPPGKYVMVIWTPLLTEHYIKKVDGTDQLITFEVQEGQAVDLGKLSYP